MDHGRTMAADTLLSVAEIGGRGRSLVAAQSLRAGQVILRESPLLLYSAFPFLSSVSPYCDHCFRLLASSSSAQKCQSCSVVSFCSHNCFISHTPWLCESLRRLHQSSSAAFSNQPSDRQVQARFLLSAYNLAASSPSDFQILLSLQGSNGDHTDTDTAAQFLHSLLSSLLCPPLPVPISPELTAALLAKDKVNAFGLMEPFSISNEKRSVRAYGIYPKTSFFNHDCLPNACRFDYVDSASCDGNNTDIIIRMIHDVPQGRELCLSYFPVNMDFSSRQKRLLEDYGFRCECDRCKVESSWSESEEEDENEVMEEMDDEEDEMEGEREGEACGNGVVDGDDDSSFPHAYFFVRYMCEKENCFGTLAPIPPKSYEDSRVLECNVCGSYKEDEVGLNQS